MVAPRPEVRAARTRAPASRTLHFARHARRAWLAVLADLLRRARQPAPRSRRGVLARAVAAECNAALTRVIVAVPGRARVALLRRERDNRSG